MQNTYKYTYFVLNILEIQIILLIFLKLCIKFDVGDWRPSKHCILIPRMFNYYSIKIFNNNIIVLNNHNYNIYSFK